MRGLGVDLVIVMGRTRDTVISLDSELHWFLSIPLLFPHG
jgi:hypothetical protein